MHALHLRLLNAAEATAFVLSFFFGFQVIAREQSIDLHRVSAFGVKSVFPQLALGREAVTTCVVHA